jgi:hypothetical protein
MLRRNPPKHVCHKALADTFFAFIYAFTGAAFCEGG